MLSPITASPAVMATVLKHSAVSMGAQPPSPSGRSRLNSFSKVAWMPIPRSAARSTMRRRKVRGHAPHGDRSGATRSQAIAALPGA